MDQKLPVPIVNVATPLPFCVPLLLAGCQSWKNWLGIVVKLWIWSGSIIDVNSAMCPDGCTANHSSKLFTVPKSQVPLYTLYSSSTIPARQLCSSSPDVYNRPGDIIILHDDMTFPGRPAVHLHLEPSVTKHWRHILGTWLAPPQICLGGSCVP